MVGMLWIVVGLLFMLFMVAVVAVSNRLRDHDARQASVDAIIESIQMDAASREGKLNKFKARLFEELTVKEENANQALVAVMDEQLDAANSRAATLRLLEQQDGTLRKLIHGHNTLGELAEYSFVCQERYGHRLECIGARMGDVEPVFTLVCSACTLGYMVVESELNEKEQGLVQEYIDSFEVPKKKPRKARKKAKKSTRKKGK